jgi:hypothetical protein
MKSIWEGSRQLRATQESFWKNKVTWTVRQFVFLLNGYEPEDLDKELGLSEHEIFVMKAELSKWREWASGCPGIATTDEHPMEVEIAKSDLISWASELEGVTLPTWMIDHVDIQKNRIGKKVRSEIGDQEKENLLATIGALALLVVDINNKENTGSFEKPNISGIARLILNRYGKVPGMADVSLRTRFSTGMSEFLENGINSFKEKNP